VAIYIVAKTLTIRIAVGLCPGGRIGGGQSVLLGGGQTGLLAAKVGRERRHSARGGILLAEVLIRRGQTGG